MAGKRSISCQKLHENFMKLWNEGYSILEIAKEYHLSVSTVYKALEEIAIANNFSSRNELLRYPHQQHQIEKKRQSNRIKVDSIDPESILNQFSIVIDGLNDIDKSIQQTLEEEEQ